MMIVNEPHIEAIWAYKNINGETCVTPSGRLASERGQGPPILIYYQEYDE